MTNTPGTDPRLHLGKTDRSRSPDLSPARFQPNGFDNDVPIRLVREPALQIEDVKRATDTIPAQAQQRLQDVTALPGR